MAVWLPVFLSTPIRWSKTFAPSQPIPETIFRGSIVYLAIFVLLRVLLRRQTGGLSTTDLLVIVLLGDAAQNAMAGSYSSVTDGLILILTIAFWAYAVDWLTYHVPLLRRMLTAPSLLLAQDGRMNRRNMRRELITEDELMEQVRQQGLADLSEVRLAYMEGDGSISVVPYQSRHHKRPEPKAS